MKLRRSLPLAGVPLAAGMSLAATALAAGSPAPVSLRVEGAARTLLATRTVRAPRSGSITKGAAPAGSCPADSAAGALSAATHGHWSGTYYKGLGIDVTTVLGDRLDPRHAYWEFFVNDRPAPKGICDTKLRRGDSLLLAAVPAKGRAELPIVVHAPKRIIAGRPFVLRAFVDTGKGHATKAVRARTVWTFAGYPASSRPELTRSVSGPHGEMRFTLTGVTSARATVVASAKGEIRSAATTIKVVK